MPVEFKVVHLTRMQISHNIAALQEFIKNVEISARDNPQGGEHEDILIAESIIQELSRAKKAPGVQLDI